MSWRTNQVRATWVGAIAASVLLTSAGAATGTTYPCGGSGESHKGHTSKQHHGHHDRGVKCDCGWITSTIREILTRLEKVEALSGVPGPQGPTGPAGPKGDRGPSGSAVVLRPVISVDTFTVPKPGTTCTLFQRAAKRVGNTWHVTLGWACASSTVRVLG